jgi:hypothetical protein
MPMIMNAAQPFDSNVNRRTIHLREQGWSGTGSPTDNTRRTGVLSPAINGVAALRVPGVAQPRHSGGAIGVQGRASFRSSATALAAL